MFDLIGQAYAQQVVPSIGLVSTNTTLGGFFGTIVSWALYAGGFIAVIFLIYGGILYITAGGDAEKATQGRTAIVNAIIGIIIIALALVLVQWAGGLANNTTTR